MNGTIARLTLSNLLRRWRGVLLALLPLTLLGLAAITRGVMGPNTNAADGLLSGFNLATVVPLVALIVGTGAISTEVDDGSIVYLLTKPVRRGRIIAVKYAVATVAALLFAVAPTALAGYIVIGAFDATVLAYTVAAAIACVVYCAVFVMIGATTGHAVMIGLIYVLLWENLICGLVGGARVLSIQYWSASIAAELSPDRIVADVNVIVASVLAVLATGAAIWYAGRRLRSLTLA